MAFNPDIPSYMQPLLTEIPKLNIPPDFSFRLTVPPITMSEGSPLQSPRALPQLGQSPALQPPTEPLSFMPDAIRKRRGTPKSPQDQMALSSQLITGKPPSPLGFLF